MNLTQEQEEILKNYDTNLYVSAGPGSGKSTLLGLLADKILKHSDNYRILILTFTNKAAASITAKCSTSDISRILSGTFHSIAYKQVKESGIDCSICDESKKRLIIKKLFNCRKDKDKFERIYQIISDLKCEYPLPKDNSLLNRYNEELRRFNLWDFDDIIHEYTNMISSGELCPPPVTHILVDELQDTSVTQLEMLKALEHKTNAKMLSAADMDQCMIEGSIIETSKGNKKIEDVEIGEEIATLCGNKRIFETITGKSCTETEEYYLIKTNKGELKLTWNHICYVRPEVSEKYVYLMYRYDLGYRIGISSGNPKTRGRGEKTDKMWIIKICSTFEEARYYEEKYSLKYQIPKATYVQHTKNQFMDNSKKLFKEFGKNGYKLLEDLKIIENYSILQTQTHKSKRICVSLLQTNSKNKSISSFQVCVEGKGLKDCIGIMGIEKGKGRRSYGVRKYISNYKDARWFAEKLRNRLENKGIMVDIQERLAINNKKFIALNVGQLHKGYNLLYNNNGNVEETKIVSIEKIKKNKKAYDLEIEKTGKLFCNGHLVHNCVYEWRSARPDNVLDFIDLFKCKVLNMGTNFRSGRKIVEGSVKVIENNKKRMPKEIRARPEAPNGVVHVVRCENHFEEIDYIVGKCLQEHRKKIAILYRNRTYKNHLEFQLRKAGIRYTVNDTLEIADRSAVKVVLSCAKIACGLGDIYELERASKALQGIGDKAVENIGKSINENKDVTINSLIEDAKKEKKTPKYWKSIISMRDYYDKNEGEKLDLFVHYIEDLFIKSFDYQKDMKEFLLDISKEYKLKREDIRELCNELGLDNKEEVNDEDADVELSTIHGFKGLEREVVMLPWIQSYLEEKPGRQIDEEAERRLFYVGITRGESKVIITYSGISVPKFIKELE